MKLTSFRFAMLVTVALVLTVTTLSAKDCEPTVGELHAVKAWHHAVYLKDTAKDAGGTNKLLHTKKLPTEGKDAIVTPALDHLYSKAVIDLTSGPVYLTMPKLEDRYYSIHITDQEHYTIYDEVRPAGTYAFVRDGYQGEIRKNVTVINSPGDYPHLFIRIQVKGEEDKKNTLAAQEQVKLEGVSKKLDFDHPIKFTLETHSIYPQNDGILSSVKYDAEEHKKTYQWIGDYFAENITDNEGMFDAIDSTEKGSNDPRIRAAAIVGHLGLPVHHSYYTGIFRRCDNGELLNGSDPFTITLPYKANVEEFWSVTRYSGLTRNTIPDTNDVFNVYNTKPNKDGNVVITFSAEDPKDGSYWMKVNEGEPYYYVERFYRPNGKVITSQDTCGE